MDLSEGELDRFFTLPNTMTAPLFSYQYIIVFAMKANDSFYDPSNKLS